MFSLPVSTATLPGWSTGQKFVIAFPENIAYFHPFTPHNKIQITALHDDTVVTIKMSTYETRTEQMTAGQTTSINILKAMELSRTPLSNDTLQITSTKDITVHAINLKSNSMQTVLVIPTDKLGTEYLIPPVPEIEGTTLPAEKVTADVTERGPFRVLIVNADKKSMVTLKGTVTKEVSLQPHQIAQYLITDTESPQTVKADQPVAVLFGHPCAIQQNCTCGQLYAMLPPAKEEKLKFYIPAVLAEGFEDDTLILLSDKDSTTVKDFDPAAAQVETASTAILYHPGLLLTLIPETDFASCYVVHPVVDMQNFIVIVVHKDFKDGVRVKNDPLVKPDWKELKGTEYVSTHAELASGNSVVWHTSSKMAVYYVGRKESGAWFGNPAAIIATSPGTELQRQHTVTVHLHLQMFFTQM